MTHPPARPGLRSVEIGVSDLDRSLAFYEGVLGFRADPRAGAGRGVLLDAGPVLLRLDEVRGGDLGGWRNDNLQRGIRHVGLRVGSVHAWARRLRDAGAEFTLEPFDAPGGVRIAFFLDPDGAHLEIVEGDVGYDTVGSPELVQRERAAHARLDPDAAPASDHVAVTVQDLDASLRLYRDGLGYPLIGELIPASHPQGFRITYLQAGAAVLELFSFTAPTRPSPGDTGTPRLGLRHVTLTDGTPLTLAPPA